MQIKLIFYGKHLDGVHFPQKTVEDYFTVVLFDGVTPELLISEEFGIAWERNYSPWITMTRKLLNWTISTL
jgi:hypothetical protein